jgi:hypothetical protein
LNYRELPFPCPTEGKGRDYLAVSTWGASFFVSYLANSGSGMQRYGGGFITRVY